MSHDHHECPGEPSIAHMLTWGAPQQNPHQPSKTPEEFRERKRGERWARWLRRYAPWLKPIILEWIVEPVAQLANEIINERLRDNRHGK